MQLEIKMTILLNFMIGFYLFECSRDILVHVQILWNLEFDEVL